MTGGLLPFSRGTIMLDVLPLAMLVVVPLLAYSTYQVRVRRRAQLHERLQTLLASLILVAVILFELDIRYHGWRPRAEPSPFYGGLLFPVLYVHLFFAVSTTVLWVFMVTTAFRQRPRLGLNDVNTRRHVRIGKLTTYFTYTTAVTGCTFYWMAFVA